jgi:hypothetical protein
VYSPSVAIDPKRHTIPIYDYYPDPANPNRPKARLLGSGVYLLVNDRPLIVTAAHILEEHLFGMVGFALQAEGKWIGIHSRDMHIIKADATEHKGNHQLAVYPDRMDVAVIAPTYGIVEYLALQYSPYVLAEDAAIEKPKHIVVRGWPGDWHNIDNYLRRVEARPIHFDCPTGDEVSMRVAGGDPKIHGTGVFDAEVDFIMGNGELADMPDLKGISGCGVWAADKTKRVGLSYECLGFAGIVVEHAKHKDVLLYIRTDVLLFPLSIALCGPLFFKTDVVQVSDDTIGHFEGQVVEVIRCTDESRIHWYWLAPTDTHTPPDLFRFPVPEHVLTRVSSQSVM